MSAPRIVVWKDRDPGERRPWIVSFLDYDRPGVELYQSREFKRWRSALRWARAVAGESVLPTDDPRKAFVKRGEQG